MEFIRYIEGATAKLTRIYLRKIHLDLYAHKLKCNISETQLPRAITHVYYVVHQI